MAMQIRRRMLEGFVWGMSRFARTTALPPSPGSIFVIQPGHIGDLLVCTPLFEALRRRFTGARIVVGAGPWNAGTVKNNPFVDEFVALSFPWNNKFVKPQGVRAAMGFICRSREVRELTARKFDIGIDLLGEHFDALLMLRLGVGYRVGGGYGFTALQQTAPRDPGVRMGETALRMAEVLGAKELPSARPQLYLTPGERARGEELWGSDGRKRLVIAPAAGNPSRSWPHERYVEVARELSRDDGIAIALVGGEDAVEVCARISEAGPGVVNRCGKLSLRETFGLVAGADATLSNSNMVLHVAAAFGLPAIVVLSESTPLARVEQALWGHDTSRMFGNEVDHAGIYTPAEIEGIVRETLGLKE
jgi:ADP-heptose:LPS heptosyltransferase